MTTVALVIAALGTAHVPATASHVTVRTSPHGAPLRRVYDGAPDTCARQFAYVDRSGRTLGESVQCWNEFDNWTRRKLYLTYTKGH